MKRIISLVSVLLFFAELFSVQISASIIGDVNHSGFLDANDGIALSRYIAGFESDPTYSINTETADLDNDSAITPRDSMILARKLAGWKGYEYEFYVNNDTHTLQLKGRGTITEIVKDLIIPGYGYGDYRVDNILSSVFKNFTLLKSVKIEEGVSNISKEAFSGCSNMTNIEFPSTLNYIGTEAFNNCSSLTEITIPGKVKQINKDAFLGCSNLKKIYFKGSSDTWLEISKESGIDSKYVICDTGLEFLNNNDGKTCKVYGRGDNNSKNLIIPQESPDGKTVTSIFIAAFDEENNNETLKSIVFPDTVESIEVGAFRCCKSLESIVFPRAAFIEIGAFDECSSLTEIYIPLETKGIGENAFRDCTNLKKVIFEGDSDQWYNLLKNFDEYLYPGFENKIVICLDERLIYSDTGMPEGTTQVGQVSYYTSEKLIIPQEHDGKKVTKIGYQGLTDSAYFGVTLRSIVIPDTVTTIGDYACSGNKELTNVEFGNSIETIGKRAFENAKITEISLPNSLKSIGFNAFSLCKELSIINYDGSIGDWKYIDKSEYWNNGCGQITVKCRNGEYIEPAKPFEFFVD